MSLKKGLLFLYTQTWLHVGSGEGMDSIDLPIQREVHTKYPVIPASSVKGSLRELAENTIHPDEVSALFGTDIAKRQEKQNGPSHAGACAVGDGKILLFPVRSLTNVFYWVTSPLALSRFARDAHMAGVNVPWTVPSLIGEEDALVAGDAPETLYLEEVGFQTKPDDNVRNIAEFLSEQLVPDHIGEAFHNKLKQHIAVISDTNFQNFVCFATHVAARIKLSENKTTDDDGNLWYEETIPPETLFYVSYVADRVRTGQLKNELTEAEQVHRLLLDEVLEHNVLQLGGNATLGHGWCAVSSAGGSDT